MINTVLVDSEGKTRKAVTLLCDFCREELVKEARFVSDKNYHKECANKARAEGRSQLIKCAHCGEEKKVTNSEISRSKSGLFFCNRKCKEAAQSLDGNCPEIRPAHYGTGSDGTSYRKKAYKNNDRKCNRCGYTEEPGILEVHHIDCNHSNNVISNLEVLCPNCHALEHFKNKTGKFGLKKVSDGQEKVSIT